jgi:hypothetical protein
MNGEYTQCADCRGLNNNNNNPNNTRFIQELDNMMWYNIDYGLSIFHSIGKNILFLAQQQPTSRDKLPLHVPLLHIPIISMQYAPVAYTRGDGGNHLLENF